MAGKRTDISCAIQEDTAEVSAGWREGAGRVRVDRFGEWESVDAKVVERTTKTFGASDGTEIPG